MHVERQRRGKATYWYLVASVREGKRVRKERAYLGKDLTAAEGGQRRKRKEGELARRIAERQRAADPLAALLAEGQERALRRAKRRPGPMDALQRRNWYESFVAEFTYDTNAIEGSTLSLTETASLLFEGIAPAGKRVREVREAENHKEAFDYLLGYRGEVTTALVLRVHKLLMHDILWKDAGRFRMVDVWIRGAEFTPPRHEKVREEFRKLMEWYRTARRRYHPVVVASVFHGWFEAVHPFRDGNGRTGRLLLNFMLRKAGYPMANITYKDRAAYYAALRARTHGDYKPLVDLVVRYVAAEERAL